MGLIEHAKYELGLIYPPISLDGDDGAYNKLAVDAILELITVFANQGHSGFSAPYVANMFHKLTKYESLTPLTCEDSEWTDITYISDVPSFQNKRLSSVFKNGKDGKPYYLDAVVFRGDKTSTFTSSSVSLRDGSTIGSSQYIKLPFTPKTFVIDVCETEWSDETETVEQAGGGWWTSVVKDESQLKEVFEYYERRETN